MVLKHIIIRHLIENRKEVTIRELSKMLGTDYKNTYEAVHKAIDSITIRKKANASYLSIANTLSDDIFLVESQRKNDMLSDKNMKLIHDDIKSMKNPLFIALLFGSYSKKTQKKHSDIDLCIIHDNNQEYNKIRSRLATHPKVQMHGFTYSEFCSMLDRKTPNVGHEIVKNAIVLHNIESYYGLLNG